MKNILILGFGKTGEATYKCLKNKGNLFIVDDNEKNPNYDVLTTKEFLKKDINLDLIVKSPGIKLNHEILIKYKNVEIINDIELAYLIVKDKNIKIIGVTGTNGKTSTTMLITKILQKAGYQAFACGNIGVSPLDIIREQQNIDYLIMELSSFQLLDIKTFCCDVALILNINDDHLDYHYNFNHYYEAKLNIIKNIPRLKILITPLDIKKEGLTVLSYLKKDIDKKNNSLSYENIYLVLQLLKVLGIDEIYLKEVLANNELNLPHRMEYVDKILGVNYINDSKATNMSATINCLNQFNNIILLVGGYDKKEKMDEIKKYYNKIKQVIAFGENKYSFDFIPGIIYTTNMQEAFLIAQKIAKNNDNVILSPASASLDQFPNYIERGNKFKKLVRKLNENNN